MELPNPKPEPDPDPDPDPNPLGACVPGDGALFERRPAERRHRLGQHRQGPTKVDFAGAGSIYYAREGYICIYIYIYILCNNSIGVYRVSPLYQGGDFAGAGSICYTREGCIYIYTLL